MKTVTLTIGGMHCHACEQLITMDLEDLSGVSSIEVDQASGQAVISFDPDVTTLEKITATIENNEAYTVTNSNFTG